MVLVLLGAAVLGPRPRFEERWVEPQIGPDVDAYLAEREAVVVGLRPGEAKSVTWADSSARRRTALAVAYLHGFSADRHEIEPLVTDLARNLSANIYFARLSGHGRDGQAMADAGVEKWLADAAEAVAVGGRIGRRVVLVGTSTGATLALWAAAQQEALGRVAALVLISPNLGLRDSASRLLLWPWGGLIARVWLGPQRCFEPLNPQQERHWTTCYPTRALLPMMALVERVRTMDLGSVNVPTLVVYSPRDRVVDPGQAQSVLARLGTRRRATFLVDSSGDPENHVLAGEIMSPETTDVVREQILEFLASQGWPGDGG